MTPRKPFKVRPMIVAFCGKKGSGKDTCAAVLKLHLARSQYTSPQAITTVQVNFADKLREICSDLFGMTLDEMINPELKEVPLNRWPFQSPRHILQQFATEGIRGHWPEMWVRHWYNRARLELQTGSIVVATDMRFPNERVAINNLAKELDINYAIINVERTSRGGTNDPHESESYAGKLSHHVTLNNGGSIEALEVIVPKKIAEALKIQKSVDTQNGNGRIVK